MAIDPICALEVPENPALSREFRGQRYFFCTIECLDTFNSAPEGYVKAVPLSSPASGAGRGGPSAQRPPG